MSLPRSPQLTDRARALRKNSTREERRLWYEFLAAYPIRFRRQRPIGPYIADFYCAEAQVVVELDGSQHYEAAAMDYDRRRTAYLQGRGLTVLRFTNTEVSRQFEAVQAAIHRTVKEALS